MFFFFFVIEGMRYFGGCDVHGEGRMPHCIILVS